MTQPVSVLADGNLKVLWVTAIANTAAPTVAELTAGTVVDLSCYLTPDGFSPSINESAVVDERLCSIQTFKKPGRIEDDLSLRYVYQPQLPLAADNKAWSTLLHLTSGFIVSRAGKLYSSAIIATDIVNVYPVQLGVQAEDMPEQNSVITTSQMVFVTGTVRRRVAVV